MRNNKYPILYIKRYMVEYETYDLDDKEDVVIDDFMLNLKNKKNINLHKDRLLYVVREVYTPLYDYLAFDFDCISFKIVDTDNAHVVMDCPFYLAIDIKVLNEKEMCEEHKIILDEIKKRMQMVNDINKSIDERYNPELYGIINKNDKDGNAEFEKYLKKRIEVNLNLLKNPLYNEAKQND